MLGCGDGCVDCAVDVHASVNKHLIDMSPLRGRGRGLSLCSLRAQQHRYSCSSWVGAAVSPGAAPVDGKVQGFCFEGFSEKNHKENLDDVTTNMC